MTTSTPNGTDQFVDIDLRMPEATVEEVKGIADAYHLTPGDVIALGASLVGLLLAIRSRKGRLIAEYPDGSRSAVDLP